MDQVHSTTTEGKKGKHLSFEERVIIQIRLKDKCSPNKIAAELGRAPKIVHIPTDVLVQAGLGGGIRGDKESSVLFDNHKLKTLTGFVPKISFREGVRKYLAGIEKHPEWKNIDPAFDQKCDAVCAAWNEMTRDFSELFS